MVPESVPFLYAVRHGQTEWNSLGRFQGHADIELDDTGRVQARTVSLRLKELLAERGQHPESFDIVSSPLLRARQSAGIIAGEMGFSSSSIRIEERLKEVSFGSWEGMTTLEVKEHFPELRKLRKTDRWNFRPPGGESYADAVIRVVNVLSSLENQSILVCHTGVMRIILNLLGGVPEDVAAMYEIDHNRALIWSGSRLISD